MSSAAMPTLRPMARLSSIAALALSKAFRWKQAWPSMHSDIARLGCGPLKTRRAVATICSPMATAPAQSLRLGGGDELRLQPVGLGKAGAVVLPGRVAARTRVCRLTQRALRTHAPVHPVDVEQQPSQHAASANREPRTSTAPPRPLTPNSSSASCAVPPA
jgi:hypothetical protein